MPLHWVYDRDALAARVAAAGGDPSFCTPPASAFYTYATGRNSPYGEQAEALLASLADGGWSAAGYAARNFQAFAEPAFAAGGGYLDASTRGFLMRARAGADATGVPDAQANAFARLPPLVAALAGAGGGQLQRAVGAMVAVTQAGPEAAACAEAAALVLEAVVLGAAPATAVRSAADTLPAGHLGGDAVRAALALSEELRAEGPAEAHAAAAARLGRNCHLPGSLSTALHAVLAFAPPAPHSSGGSTGEAAGTGAYAAAVRATIAQGGCNASRAGFIGAVLAAALGEGAIPEAWAAQTAGHALASARVDAVLRGDAAPPEPPA